MSLKDLIQESSGGSAAFREDSLPGETVTGEVITAIVRQSTKYQPPGAAGPKILESWDDGTPKQQVVITLRTSLRDQYKTDDDGVRTIYVKWWGPQRQALLSALSAAKADDVLPGGQFTAEFVGLGEKQPGLNAAKLYRFAYAAPNSTAKLFAPAAVAAPEQPWATPTAANVTPPAAPAAPAAASPADMNATIAQIRKLAALNIPPANIAEAVGHDIATVAAILNIPAN